MDTCEVCGATDEVEITRKFIGLRKPEFGRTCDRCGRTICSWCLVSHDMHEWGSKETYDTVCSICFNELREDYASKWDEEYGDTSTYPNPYKHEED